MPEDRSELIAQWDHEFQTWADDYRDGVKPLPGEHVIDVWAELPSYGGIGIYADTNLGRRLSPWYDQSPYDGYDEHGNYRDDAPNDVELVENMPDEYLSMMYGATEFTEWLLVTWPSGVLKYYG